MYWPPAKRLLSALTTFVDSALLGRKLSVRSFVSSASLLPSGAIPTTSRSQIPSTAHLLRRPVTNEARRLMKRGMVRQRVRRRFSDCGAALRGPHQPAAVRNEGGRAHDHPLRGGPYRLQPDLLEDGRHHRVDVHVREALSDAAAGPAAEG